MTSFVITSHQIESNGSLSAYFSFSSSTLTLSTFSLRFKNLNDSTKNVTLNNVDPTSVLESGNNYKYTLSSASYYPNNAYTLDFTATAIDSFGTEVMRRSNQYGISAAPSTYTVTYDDLITMPPNQVQYNIGDDASLTAPGTVMLGYTFGGWSLSQPGGSQTPVTAPYSPGTNVTLYAVWTQNQNQNAVCFLGSAPVLTPAGYRRVDSLSAGDLVRTADGRDVAIVRAKHQRIETPSATVNPYVIPKGRWGATENLAISPRHCVAVPGRGMVEARELGLKQMPMRAAFDYYNLELPEWDNMVVAGVEVESLAPKKHVAMTVAQFAALAASMPAEKRAGLLRMATVVEGGKVAVSLTRKERRMRA